MTINVSNTNQTNTFEFWRVRTNEIANALSNYVVTTESNTATGNAAISGTFTASSFKISNTSGSWVLTPFVANNYVFSGSATNQIIDSIQKSLYSGAEYLITVVDNGNTNNKNITKVLVTYNSSQTFMTEYGTIATNGYLGNFSSSGNSTHISLVYDSSVSNTTVKFSRVAL